MKIGSTLVKASFLHPAPKDELAAFLDELQQAGFTSPKPSSYASVFHARVRTPRTTITTEATLTRRFGRADRAEPWQEAWPGRSWEEKRKLRDQLMPGPYWIYDMRSAYAWAAGRLLPDTRCPIHVRRPSGKLGRMGIYLLREPTPTVACPPPRFRAPHATGHQWVTCEEIEQLGIVSPECVYGIEFDGSVNLARDIGWIFDNFTEKTAKAILRAFWGVWGMATGAEEVIMKTVQTPEGYSFSEKTRVLPSIRFNPVWQHFTISRVNLRVAEWAKAAAQVYVDAVIVPHDVPCGREIGGWQLKSELPAIRLHGAGNYDDGHRIIKHAGRPASTVELVT